MQYSTIWHTLEYSYLSDMLKSAQANAGYCGNHPVPDVPLFTLWVGYGNIHDAACRKCVLYSAIKEPL